MCRVALHRSFPSHAIEIVVFLTKVTYSCSLTFTRDKKIMKRRRIYQKTTNIIYCISGFAHFNNRKTMSNSDRTLISVFKEIASMADRISLTKNIVVSTLIFYCLAYFYGIALRVDTNQIDALKHSRKIYR